MKSARAQLTVERGDRPSRPADTFVVPVVTRPHRYAWRMIAFLVVVGTLAALLHEAAYRFFLRNPPLNSLIVSVLVLGIGLSFRAVLSLDPEVDWVQRLRQGDPGVLTEGPPPLLALLAAMLRDPRARQRLGPSALRSVLDGVDSRLDERRETSRYLIALLIFLGLLGTFWGLLMTATSVGQTIRELNVASSDPAEMFQTLRAGLEAPLSGMGTAFSTSLFGLASSLVLGFLDLQASQAQNRFANELETWLTSLTGFDGAGSMHEDGPAPSYVYALLERTTESFDDLKQRMTRSIDEQTNVDASLRTLAERLARLTDALQTQPENARTTDVQDETRALLTRIARALERRSDGFDEAMRAHLRSLDGAVGRLLTDSTHGRERLIDEIRGEIRLLARTLSVIADQER